MLSFQTSVYFSIQRVHYLVFVCENDNFVYVNDLFCLKSSVLLIIMLSEFD